MMLRQINHIPRVVVVGYGIAGRQFHSYLIGLTPRLALHGIVARSPETRQQAQAERGCRVYDTLDEALADPQVDLLVIATPHSEHAPQSIAGLRAGKHVVVDKVMCLNSQQCAQMIDEAEKANRMLTVFHNRRLDGDFLTVRQVIEQGLLGEVRWVDMSWHRWGEPRTWRSDPAQGGGRLYDLGAHMLDQMLCLFPQPIVSVHCQMNHDLPNPRIDSHAIITLKFDNGVTGVIDTSSFCQIHKPRFNLFGRKGQFTKHGLDAQEEPMKAGHIDSAVEKPEEYGRLKTPEIDRLIPTIPGRWRSFYENVADVLTKGAAPLVKLSEMRRLMNVFDAVFESASTNQVIKRLL